MATSIEMRKRADGTVAYRVRFRLEKGGNPVVETFDNHDDAKDFQNLIATVGGVTARKIRQAASEPSATLTIETALEEYLVHVATYAARGTDWEYRRVAERSWLPRFGKLPANALTREDVEAWVAEQRVTKSRRGTPYSQKTIRNAQGLLSSVLQYQVEKGTLVSNPAKKIKIPRDEARREMVFLTVPQFTRVLSEIPEKWQPLFSLLFATGMRWGEVTALKKGDFDLESTPATVRISRAWKRGPQGTKYVGAPKSRAGYRTITLPASVAREMEEILDGVELDDELVFPAPRGDHAHQLHEGHMLMDVWRPACKRAKLGTIPRIHDLRHSHVAVLIGQGVPLPVIQRRLGHESIKTTVDTYGHLTHDSIAGAAEAMEAAMAPMYPRIETEETPQITS